MLNHHYSNAADDLQVAADLAEAMGDVNELVLSLGRLVEVCLHPYRFYYFECDCGGDLCVCRNVVVVDGLHLLLL